MDCASYRVPGHLYVGHGEAQLGVNQAKISAMLPWMVAFLHESFFNAVFVDHEHYEKQQQCLHFSTLLILRIIGGWEELHVRS